MKIMGDIIRFSTLSLGLAGLMACGPAIDSASDIKVTNGRVISEKSYPAVFQLAVSTPSGREGTCTATFVTDAIALTAAHCVNSGKRQATGAVEGHQVRYVEATGGESGTSNVIATSIELYQHPDWDIAGGVNNTDLGVIIFPKGTARAVAPIRKKTPHVGDKITIVGYGINDYTGFGQGSAGVKRLGENEVASVEGGFIKFSGTPENSDASGLHSASGSGDSGGPLFIDGELAGTTSGGGVRDGKKHSFYVDLTTASSQKFLKRFIDSN